MKPRPYSLFYARCSAARIVFTAAAVAALASSASAASATWSGTTDATWATGTNWSTTPVPGTGDTATFNNAGGASDIIDLGAGVTIGNILFDTSSAAAYTIGTGLAGSQTLTLNNTSSITVNSTVSNDQIFNSAITLGTTRDTATTTLTNNGALGLTFNGAVTGATAGGSAGNKTLVIGGAGDITFNGNISKGGAANLWLTKTGAGTLFLNGTTTLTASGSTQNVVTVSDGSKIDLGTTGQLFITSTTNAARGLFSNSSGTISGGTISNAGSIRFESSGSLTIESELTSLAGTVNGAGTLRLTNANNSFTEDLRITGPSTVIVTSLGALGLGSNIALTTTNFGPATLVFEGAGGQLNKSFSLFAGTSAAAVIDQSGTGLLNITGAITGGTAGSLTLRGSTSGAGQISGDISIGTTPITKSGSGTWTLSGDNTYGTTAINGGILTFAQTASTGSGTVTAAAAGTVGLGIGGTGYYSAADVGAMFNSNSLTGFSLNAGSGVAIDTSNATGGSFDQTTALTGARALTKLGTGTLVMSQTNTYTGATNVNAGTLLVNGSTAVSSTINVASGATLGGTGTINGAVNVTGQLSPGASIETLATGTLSMANTSTLVHELNSSVAKAVGSDLLIVNGDLNLTGTVNLTLEDLALVDIAFAVNDKFSLINYTGTWNNGLFTFDGNLLSDDEIFAFGLNTWKISYNDVTGGLNYDTEYVAGSFVNMTAMTVIPEPGAALLGGLGFLILLRRRR